MKILTLQNEYNDLRQRIAPAKKEFRFLTERQDDGSPHVEIKDGQYHLITTERGLELSRRSTKEKDELLYWLISLDTFWMGVEFELQNRIEGQDFRRLLFARQIELLKRVDSDWAKRKGKEIELILAKHPFKDNR